MGDARVRGFGGSGGARDFLNNQYQRSALIDLNIGDLLAAYHLHRFPLVAGLVRRLVRSRAASFADEILGFDEAVGSGGLIAGGEYVLRHFSKSVEVDGREHIPRSGPLLIASNHPGMVDAMAVWVALGRTDLRIIAAERDLLDLLPNTLRHLILIRPNSGQAIRETLAHLKSGGAVLTFPAGKIEPDPALNPDAHEGLREWSPSLVTLAHRVPGTVILPTWVQGVISPLAVRHPILRLYRDRKERDWAAATLQILVNRYRQVAVRVRFGPGIRSGAGETADDCMGRIRAALGAG
ncbi:MAG: 1-acyl-sn-glycerol-3-phosphate acyltransferase [Fimbriimonas sp.]